MNVYLFSISGCKIVSINDFIQSGNVFVIHVQKNNMILKVERFCGNTCV